MCKGRKTGGAISEYERKNGGNIQPRVTDCWLGAIGAGLMLVGDLCLSVIPASPEDSGLFLREAYLNGNYPAWRLPLLLFTGLLGMMFCIFAVRAVYTQIRPQNRRTRKIFAVCGAAYLVSAGALHFMIGSFADWTSTLAPLLGREATAALIQEKYARVLPAALIAYIGMAGMILISAWAVLTRRTILPRWMFVFHMLVWQIVFAMIPDVRRALGAEVSTWDFVLSQCSGNAALLIWMAASAVWMRRSGGRESADKAAA